MEQGHQVVNPAYDADELLRKYPEWLDQAKTLKRLLEQADALNEDALIEQYALRRGQLDGLPVGKGFRASRTESLALALDQLRDDEKAEQEASLRKWAKDLAVLEMKIALYEVATHALTKEEMRLVRLHFQKGYSLRRLAAGTVPLIDRIAGAPSLYCLGQMKRRILTNVAMALAT